MVGNLNSPRYSKAELIAQILEFSQNHSLKKGRAGYWNIPILTYLQIRDSLRFTMKNGLMAYVRKDGVYRTTRKGTDFVKSYREMCKLFSLF